MMYVLAVNATWRKQRGRVPVVRAWELCPMIRFFELLVIICMHFLIVLTSTNIVQLASSAESHLTEHVKVAVDEKSELPSRTLEGSKSSRRDEKPFSFIGSTSTIDHVFRMVERIGRNIDPEDNDGSLSNLLNDLSMVFGSNRLKILLEYTAEHSSILEWEDISDVSASSIQNSTTAESIVPKNENAGGIKHEELQDQTVQQQRQSASAKGASSDHQEKDDSNEQEEYYDDELYFADWHVQQMLDVINDPDCMEGDVDATSSDFSIERAAQIWHKCRLLVVRDLFDRSTIIEPFLQNVTQFMYDLNDGKVNPYGRTSYGEDFFIYDVDVNRWDLVLPSRLLPQDIVAHPTMISILKHELVLGENLSLLSNGIHMSEGGSREQQWHNDAPYLYGIDGTLRYHGAAGLEYPSTEITMFIPLLNITGQHGPTQFCMGSSALQGLELPEGSEKLLWYNETLKEEFFSTKFAIHEGSGFMDEFCPPRMWRSTEVQLGDLVLWDYDLLHRAGYNNSTDFRSAVYGVFARTENIKDTNFHNATVEEMIDFSERSYHMGRFATIPHYPPQPVLGELLTTATTPPPRPPLTFANIESTFLSSTSCHRSHDVLSSSSFCQSTET